MAVGKSCVLVFSGSDGHDVNQISELKYSYRFSKDVLAYNTVKDTWRIIGEMPYGVVNTSVVPWQGKLIIAGGEIHPSVRTPEILVLDIPGEIPRCP
jgi:N-acetylneuraminic acid mutarotase